ncbi:MAG: c-type cytochrome [Vicinamibacterales bacterium]
MSLFKKALVSLLVLVALVVAGGTAWFFTTYPAVPPAEPLTVAGTPAQLARGEYLFEHVAICVDCHSTRDWSRFGGPVTPGTEGRGGDGFTHDLLPVPGDFYAKNITPAALGEWSDGEILRAVTTGVSKDGTALFPIMPYQNYAQLDRDDVEAIVAYVRTLAPIANHVPERRMDFPMPLLVRTIPRPAAFVTRPDASDRVAYGEYLVRMAGCADCHSPRDAQGAPVPGQAFSGGMEIRFPWGGSVRPANLTPDADTGLGTWTEAQFVDKFKAWDGVPDRVMTDADRHEQTIMPWKAYSGMTRDDLGAIYAYLRSLPPVIHRVEKWPAAGQVAAR